MPFTFTPGENGGWVVGTAEPTVPPFGLFTYTIQPVGGWVLEDMTQPASFFGGFASVGPQGPQGEPGQDGDSATITVGTTTTGAAGTDATVVNVGTASAAVLDFTIPQGIQGIQGLKGDKGDTGDSGVAYATSPLAYDALTKTVSIDLSAYATISSLGSAAYEPTSYWIQSPTVAATDGQIPAWDAATSKPVWIDNAARTLFITAKNQSGSTIPACSVVYISGATGANPLISLAQANAEATSATTIGITSTAIANGATGQVVTAGLLTKVDTSTWTEGTGLYLSATTAGGFATTVPIAPNHGVYLGVVTRSHHNQGAIEVTIKNYQELEEMSDVLIATPANGDLLVYETASSLWKNKTLADAGIQATLPSASTTVEGKVELATDAEAIAGTDASLAITPAALQAASLGEIVWDITPNSAGSSTTSGTGASVGLTNAWNKEIRGPTSAVGYANLRFGVYGSHNTIGWNGNFNFSLPMVVDALIARNNGTDSNCEGWITIGDGGTIGNNGAPNDKSFGLKIVGTNVYGFVHDGTTLSVSGSFVSLVAGAIRRATIYSDGLGSVSFNIDGTTFTMTGGPTGVPATTFRNAISIKVINNAILTGSTLTVWVSKLKLKIR